MLEATGLSDRSEQVYRAMLGHHDHGVADLAADTGLSALQVHDALNELACLALLRPATGAGPAVEPTAADQAALEAELAAVRTAITAITAAHAHAHGSGHGPSGAGEGAHRLPGLDAVRARLEELQQLTESECLSLNPGGSHLPNARDTAKPLNQLALERGVAIRAVCRDGFRHDPDTLAYARWLTDLGGQMRTVATVPIQLVVIDRTVAVLPLDPDDPGAGALEVRSPAALTAVCALFDRVWAAGVPLGGPERPDRDGCTPMESALLGIIAGGQPDDVAARRLGLPLRTVRRMMADLMTRLGAASRFQAGVNASRRGWL
ncbi:LuxR family transcriptional regulator [Kitasatospora viridis]|uniref:HTH luxR-type domain-containing protein n=1 Tax=Kitasatospora viridis TaxID=281105 RepID=A0A561SFY4_9ACTN|nr:LuxR family transcriptional regulator [Kitasatospora viridis]TWF73780.1 hypothetical protein FHX73_15407 [Kitasatospora viridis]